jgi:hypothetical protein
MDITPRSEIGLLPPEAITIMAQPDGWVVHWVGSEGMAHSLTFEQACQLLRNLQAVAFAENYVDIEYNFAVDPDGRTYELRGWDAKSGANGSTNYNAHAWAVVYLAGPGVPLTENAKDALAALTQEGARRNAAVSYVRPHGTAYSDRGLIASQCPGPDCAPFCDELQARLHTPLPVKPLNIVYGPTRELPGEDDVKAETARVPVDSNGCGYVDFTSVPADTVVSMWTTTLDPEVERRYPQLPRLAVARGHSHARVVIVDGRPNISYNVNLVHT